MNHPSGFVETLDHVAVVSDRPETLFSSYERLGFQLTPLTQHSGAVKPGEQPYGETDPEAPMVWVKQVDLKSGDWHHIAVTWENFFFVNLLPVTLGNIFGGAVMVGLVYWYVYHRDPAE